MKTEFCWKSFSYGLIGALLMVLLLAAFEISETVDEVTDYGRAHKWELTGIVETTCEKLSRNGTKCHDILCAMPADSSHDN